MSDIFRKTPLGFEEIATRAHGLSARLRRCLILVDGSRTVAELMFLMPGENMITLLQALEADGYISMAEPSRLNVSNAASSVPNAASPLSGKTQILASMDTAFYEDTNPINPALMFKDSQGKLRTPLTFLERKQRGVRAVNELLGPEAEGVALKIESCKIDAELELALQAAAKFVESMLNTSAARKFKDHVRLVDSI